NGWRPLHLAVHRGDKELTQILLAAGAEANAKNGEGQSALTIALEKSHEEVADLLRRRGGPT
ncbi:MAG TPA: ankyrin repeat domain-containing protein, partial [Nitrososphaera sp.]|nr:ankyrin repeat domain-containing protein [Nitrososphaera sp.]